MPKLPSPHGDKLHALLHNEKLPRHDHLRVEQAVTRYDAWLRTLETCQGAYPDVVGELVAHLNDHKRYIEIDLIFDGENDFLYRQKGVPRTFGTKWQWVSNEGLRVFPPSCVWLVASQPERPAK